MKRLNENWNRFVGTFLLISSGSIEQLLAKNFTKYQRFFKRNGDGSSKFLSSFSKILFMKNLQELYKINSETLKCLSVNWILRNNKFAAISRLATFRPCLRRSAHQPLLSSQLGKMPEHPHPRLLREAVRSPNWRPTIGQVPRIPIARFVLATWRICRTPTHVFTSFVLPVCWSGQK